MRTEKKAWSLLSKHGKTLILLANNPKLRIVDLARTLSISERSARLLVASLHRSNVLVIKRAGRNNTYQVNFSALPPDPLEKQIPMDTILKLVPHFPASPSPA